MNAFLQTWEAASRPSTAPLVIAAGEVAVFSKPRHADVPAMVRQLRQELRASGRELVLDDNTARAAGEAGGRDDWAQSQPALAIALGGDGTLLHAARQLRTQGTPLLGVNLGTLGFLTELAPEEMAAGLAQVLQGEAREDRRSVLAAEVRGATVKRLEALNDFVISKGPLARVIDFELMIEGENVAHYRADGLIVATPTGSTAYSLSAGGPLVQPELAAWAITPICPHALNNRPLLVRDTARIEIHMLAVGEQTYLTMDGQPGCPLAAGDRIIFQKSPHDVRLVRRPGYSYYDLLRRKLKWG